MMYLVPFIAVAVIIMPLIVIAVKGGDERKRRNAFRTNLVTFVATLVLMVALPVGLGVNAEVEADAPVAETTAAESAKADSDGLGYIAAALATGFGSIGCGIAVAAAAPAAIGAVSEEPKAFSKALIFVALGEGVALYGFLISFMILGKLG
ncbi:MAG: ATPase [Ruminococcus sp.]|nr:ATPase [Ruminococcus sp.]